MTFATTYWLKRAALQQPIVATLVFGSGHRQAACSLRCAHTTVTRQAARVGRHSSLLDRLLARVGTHHRLVLITDDHPDYRSVVSQHPGRHRIEHKRYRNPRRGPKGAPRSAEAQARDEAMFEVDQLHRLLRHSQAADRRKTLAFARRVSGVMERAFAFAVWRNLVKARSERRPRFRTPAMQAGLTDHRWDWREVFRERLFPSLARRLSEPTGSRANASGRRNFRSTMERLPARKRPGRIGATWRPRRASRSVQRWPASVSISSCSA